MTTHSPRINSSTRTPPSNRPAKPLRSHPSRPRIDPESTPSLARIHCGSTPNRPQVDPDQPRLHPNPQRGVDPAPNPPRMSRTGSGRLPSASSPNPEPEAAGLLRSQSLERPFPNKFPNAGLWTGGRAPLQGASESRPHRYSEHRPNTDPASARNRPNMPELTSDRPNRGGVYVRASAAPTLPERAPWAGSVGFLRGRCFWASWVAQVGLRV